jgi:hypothetical protein
MLIAGIAGVLSGSLIGCGGNATDLPGLIDAYSKMTSYKVEIKAPDGQGVKQVVKLKAGMIVKMKMATPMGTSIMDFENKCNYMIMGSNVMKMPFDKNSMSDETNGMTPSSFKDSPHKILRSEKLGDVDCLVIESTEDNETGTVWIGSADGLIRQSVSGKEKVEFIYTEINAVKDSEFELPKGAEVKDMTQMMGNMQKMFGGN